MPATWKQLAYKDEVLPGLLSPYAVGDLIYASTTTVLSKLADVDVGQVLVSGGVGVAPAWSATPTVSNLTIESATDSIGLIHRDGTVTLISYVNTTGSAYGWLGTFSNHNLMLGAYGYTGGTLTVTPSRRVGIGTPTPGYPLEVVGNAYFSANVSALSYTDRTPHFEGDAIAAIMSIKSKDGQIDHTTLPEFARKEEGRDIGAMVSILTVAIQQMQTQIELLRTKIK